MGAFFRQSLPGGVRGGGGGNGTARQPLGAFKGAGGRGEAAAVAAAAASGAGARGAARGVRSGPEAPRRPGPGRELQGARAAQREPAAQDMAKAGGAGESGRLEGRAGGRGRDPRVSRRGRGFR